jgi:hypothetical protein
VASIGRTVGPRHDEAVDVTTYLTWNEALEEEGGARHGVGDW